MAIEVVYKEGDYTFGYDFFVRLKLLAPLMFPEFFNWATFFTIATLLASIGSEYIAYHIGMYPGKMYGALISHDHVTFWHVFTEGSFMYLLQCFALGVISLFSWLLYLAWRRNLNHALHALYFSNHVYYRLNAIDARGIDNPDQRITQDVERMCQGLATKIMPAALIGPCIVIWYTYKTWISAGFLGIGIIYGYFVIGTTLNKFLISPMVKWNARVERCEGNFRFKHVSVRTNAESSVLYKAEQFEHFQCNSILEKLLKTQIFFAVWRFPNAFWQQFFDYYGGLLSYAIQVIPIFALNSYADLDAAALSTKISNNAFVYIYLINSFTRMTDAALFVGEIAGILQRVAEFVKQSKIAGAIAVGESDWRKKSDSVELNQGQLITYNRQRLPDDVLYELINIGYSLPNDRNYRLLEGLNFLVRKRQNIMITGDSGAGKTSLLRILARVWNTSSGSIRHGECISMHLPQQPYFPTGGLNLREQIYFPKLIGESDRNELADARILSILGNLKLMPIVERCGGLDMPIDFEIQEVVTAGEQQRLSFARLLFHRPTIAVLDEAMSSVSIDVEQNMYRVLKENDIQYISAGHRTSLLAYHDLELHLDGKTGYTIREIRSASSDTSSPATIVPLRF